MSTYSIYSLIPRVIDMDYYLERASIRLVNLFGTFYDVVLFLMVAVFFCSLVMWLILPIIEYRKKVLLKKIYEQLLETQEIVYSIKKDLSNSIGKDQDVG
jgi:hypothetical protein